MSSVDESGSGAADTGADHEAAHQKTMALGVLDCTLDRALWTHEAHLDFAAGIVRLCGAEASMTVSRAAIQKYNEVSNCANTDSGGYHETLTAYFCAVSRSLWAPWLRGSDFRTIPCFREMPRSRSGSENRCSRWLLAAVGCHLSGRFRLLSRSR